MLLGYNTIENFLTNIFGSRAKEVNPKYISLWVREILIRQPDTEILEKVQERIVGDDEIPLTVATVCKIIEQEIHNKTMKAISQNKNCPYCNGTGIATIIAKFSNTGKFVSDNVALKCHCSTSKQKLLQMNYDPQTNNRTDTDGGYYLVFETVVQRDKYLAELRRQKTA